MFVKSQKFSYQNIFNRSCDHPRCGDEKRQENRRKFQHDRLWSNLIDFDRIWSTLIEFKSSLIEKSLFDSPECRWCRLGLVPATLLALKLLICRTRAKEKKTETAGSGSEFNSELLLEHNPFIYCTKKACS